MKRNENVIIWSFFSVVFIGSYMLLSQQNESIARYAYLISAFFSISLTFLLDRFMKKRNSPTQAKKNSQNPAPANSIPGSGQGKSKNAKRKTGKSKK
ncbi:hypothetical protein [Desulfitobacterium sp.]|uniref:hypothetical protein n=1 Tax=Desulfitobacterium sp. TaxID=49981 RepID=UPI002C620535|nr:hypothetical protein [Desulfitobacterium sp.]HVJ49955.1 hypothetical protein [Desulfitobacterium sp.]